MKIILSLGGNFVRYTTRIYSKTFIVQHLPRSSLEHDSMMLFNWFSDNPMKANISKFHLPVNKKDEVTVRIGDTEFKNSEYEKLLGIKVNTKLNFNEHLNDTISKAKRKNNVLSRVMSYMSLSKKRKLVNSFLTHNLVTAYLFGYSIVAL